MHLLKSAAVGVGLALIVWMCGMFITGEIYSFMDQKESLTRLEMLLLGGWAGVMHYTLKKPS